MVCNFYVCVRRLVIICWIVYVLKRRWYEMAWWKIFVCLVALQDSARF